MFYYIQIFIIYYNKSMEKCLLKKIEKINNFGSFKNFNADNNLNEFQQYNLIWGLNGTGKTTLSRFFECLNLGFIPKEYDSNDYKDDFSIKLSDEDNQYTTLDTFKDNFYIGKIKIFNNHFVETNLSLDSSTAKTKAITYTIGETNKDLKTKITELEKELESYYIEHKGKTFRKIDFDIENIEKNITNEYTNIATKIRADLCIPSQKFTRDHFFLEFSNERINGKPEINKTEKEEAQKKFTQPSKEKLTIVLDELILGNEINTINDLLKQTVTRKQNCNDELMKWLAEGLKHKTTTQCPFCHQDTDSIWELRYNEIQEVLKKDDSYLKLENEILKMIDTLNQRVQIANTNKIFNLRVSDFINEIDDEKLNNYKTSFKKYIESVNSIISVLRSKQNNKDLTPDISDFISQIKDFGNIKSAFNQTIINNNKSVETIEQDKSQAKKIVIKYYIAENFDNLNSQISNIDNLNAQKEPIIKKIDNIKSEIDKLKAELSNQKLPIAEIEKYINIVFGYKKFQIEFEDITNSYIIKRDGDKIAKNLSEGEKTVIAFAYFLATLKSKDFDFSKSIIVIDDPVSSLDQQYLFNLLNLLMNKFASHKTFSQLFILTHNFYFFKKIRAILFNKNKDYNNNFKSQPEQKQEPSQEHLLYEVFQIQKNETSYINNADKYLKSFDSEYSYTISYLRNALKLPEEDLKQIPLGNSIRKILEIFLAFRCPKEKTIFTRYNKVIKEWDEIDKNKFKYLQDIANATSHTEGCEDLEALEEFKLFIGKNEINQLFEFIKKADELHYNQLPK